MNTPSKPPETSLPHDKTYQGYLDTLSLALRRSRTKPRDWERRIRWSGEDQVKEQDLDEIICDITFVRDFGPTLPANTPFNISRHRSMIEYAKMCMRSEPWITVNELYPRLLGYSSGYTCAHNEALTKSVTQ